MRNANEISTVLAQTRLEDLAIMSDGVMNDAHDLWCVTLSEPGVFSCTGSMIVPTITKQVETLRQAGVKASDSPRFLDKLSSFRAKASFQAVHTSVKISKLEPKFCEEVRNLFSFPIATTSRPLDEAHGPFFVAALSHFFEVFPDFPMKLFVFFNFLECSVISH